MKNYQEWYNENQEQPQNQEASPQSQETPQQSQPHNPDLEAMTSALEPVGQAINNMKDQAVKQKVTDLYSKFWGEVSSLIQGTGNMSQPAVPQDAGQSAAPAPEQPQT